VSQRASRGCARPSMVAGSRGSRMDFSWTEGRGVHQAQEHHKSSTGGETGNRALAKSGGMNPGNGMSTAQTASTSDPRGSVHRGPLR